MKNQKGQISGLSGFIALLIVVSILIGTGMLLIEEFQELDEFSDTPYTATNETGGFINHSGYTLDDSTFDGFNSPVMTAAWNSSGDDGEEIPLTNFTVSSVGVVTNTTGDTWLAVEFSYTYNGGEAAYEGIDDTLDAVTTVPELLGLIILIVMVGVVLSIIFNVIEPNKMSGA